MRCTVPELNRFIDAFEWGTEHASPDDLEGKVKYGLSTSGKLKSVDDAEVAFEHLFHFVFALLSKRSSKILTPKLLVEELKKLDQAETGRSILSNLRGIETILQTRFDRLEEQIVPLQSDMHGVKATLARIEGAGAVTSLQESGYDRSGDPRDVGEPRSHYLATSQVIASENSGYEMSSRLSGIVLQHSSPRMKNLPQSWSHKRRARSLRFEMRPEKVFVVRGCAKSPHSGRIVSPGRCSQKKEEPSFCGSKRAFC